METIREYLKKVLENPPVLGAVGLVIGIILGLLYGWVINPVDWVDAPVQLLREDLKVDHLRMTIDSYAYNQDLPTAVKRWERLGEGAEEILTLVEFDPQTTKVSDIDSFRSNVVEPLTGQETMEEGEMPEEEPAETGGGGNLLRWFLLLLTLAIGAVVAYRYLSARRAPQTGGTTPASVAQDFTESMETTDYAERGEVPPMHQFTTTYVLGDNLFDDSFSIESASGEFLGECGVGISESIGVGEAKRVTAFDVWLFDQNDISTVTKVLMSSHAYYDDALREELEKKGEPILAEPGIEFVLETQNLRIIVRVMDMVYGEGPLPEGSYFERMSLELSIWPNTVMEDFGGSEFDNF
jgi:hypothetical protein